MQHIYEEVAITLQFIDSDSYASEFVRLDNMMRRRSRDDNVMVANTIRGGGGGSGGGRNLRKARISSTRPRESAVVTESQSHGDQQHNNGNGSQNQNNGEMSGIQIELPRRPGDKYRNQVLNEVGLDEILYDDESESQCNKSTHSMHVPPQLRQSPLIHHEGAHANNNNGKHQKRKDKKKKRRKVRLSQELLMKESARIKQDIKQWNGGHDYEYDEEEGVEEDDGADEDSQLLDEDEDEDDDPEYESFDPEYDNQESSTPYWRSTAKRIIYKLIYICMAISILLYITFGDEIVDKFFVIGALQEGDEDVNAEETVSKEGYIDGYKDARIPDDDIAQYGGGILGAEVFGKKKNEGGDLDYYKQDDDRVYDEVGQEVEEQIDQEEQQQDQSVGYHEHTGVASTDALWEQLNGYAEMVEPYNSDRDLPVFWHVPKSGGTTLQDLLMHCVGMVGANEVGGPYAKDTPPVEVVQMENGNRYVNVDMASPVGIRHAKDMGIAQSGLANVVLTSWFDQAASVFDDQHKGRCFTLLRHPIRRAVSMFYYLKDATWEHTYSEVYKNMTIEEYASSEYSEDNWMTRFLTNEMTGGVYEMHLELAKEVLQSKCVVGIMDEFTPSLKRFNQYFGWMDREFGGSVPVKDRGKCVSRVIGHPDNKHPHPEVEEGDHIWNILMAKNELDLSLYEYAVHLFHDVQSQLVDEWQANNG